MNQIFIFSFFILGIITICLYVVYFIKTYDKPSNYININEVKYLIDRINYINSIPLEDAIFVEDGDEINVDESIIDGFKSTGLNNIDFIISDFYKQDLEK